MEEFGYSVDVVREHNIKVIFNILYKKPMSCKELASIVGLSETAVKKNIVQMLESGAVVISEGDDSQKKNVGRQHIRYTINSKFGVFVLIDLSHRHDSFYIKDFTGKTIFFNKLQLPEKIKLADLLNICEIIKNKLKEFNTSVKEIAISISGQVIESTGEIVMSSRLEEKEITNIKTIFVSQFGIKQIYVKNDLRFSAYGDPKYLERSNKSIAYYVYVGYGIVSAIVKNGKIVSGVNDIAGEIGQSTCSNGIDLHTNCSVDSLMLKFNCKTIEELIKLYSTSKEVYDAIIQSSVTLASQVQPILDALGCVDIILLGEVNEFGEDYIDAFKKRINEGYYRFEKQVTSLDYKSLREKGMLEVLKNHVSSIIE